MGAKQVHLYGLVAQYTGTDIKAISQKSQLSEDLGLDGVAAVHFLRHMRATSLCILKTRGSRGGATSVRKASRSVLARWYWECCC